MKRMIRISIIFIFALSVLMTFQHLVTSNDPLTAATKKQRSFIPSAEEVFQETPSTEFVPSTIAYESTDNAPMVAMAKSAMQDEDAASNDAVDSEASGASIIDASGLSKEDRAERYKRGEIDFYLLRQTRYYEDQPPAFPKELLALKDKKVKMLGFMSPYDDLNSMKNFMLMPMMTGCFFCVPPSIEEVLLVRQETEEHCPYIAEPIVLEGTLKLWNQESDDPVYEMFLYVIEDAKVRVYDPEKDAHKPNTQDHNSPH